MKHCRLKSAVILKIKSIQAALSTFHFVSEDRPYKISPGVLFQTPGLFGYFLLGLGLPLELLPVGVLKQLETLGVLAAHGDTVD